MSFNFSLNVGFLTQTHTYGYGLGSSPSTLNSSNNITVVLYPQWYRHVSVEWSVPSDWGACLFNVYFSPNEYGPFERINPSPVDGTYLLDRNTQEYSKFHRGYYRVEAILTSKGNVAIISGNHSVGVEQRRWVQLRSIEIQRREYLLLTRFTGVKSYLFRRKNYGQRCTECWNEESEKSIKDSCNTCLGTTFKGGYFPAAPCYIQYEPSPNANTKTYFGVFEPNQISAWTISFPEITTDDIIIRVGDWNVYRVDRVADTELQANAVRQVMQITQLSKNDIEFQLVSKNLPEFPPEYL